MRAAAATTRTLTAGGAWRAASRRSAPSAAIGGPAHRVPAGAGDPVADVDGDGEPLAGAEGLRGIAAGGTPGAAPQSVPSQRRLSTISARQASQP
jgi:hypothetical protein